MRFTVGARTRAAMALAALAFAIGGCGWAGAAGASATEIPLPTRLPDQLTFQQVLTLFEYDRSRPFDVLESSRWPLGRVEVSDVTYSGASGMRLPAYLVVPPGEGPFAGVVWMGWSGNWNHIRDEFLAEAVLLADRGVASVIVAGYFPWYAQPSSPAADRTSEILQVRELRRAVDLLLAQSGVDASRIAFVGHGAGAMHGLSLAAADHRLRAAVLLAPNPAIADLAFSGYGLDPATEPAYREALAPFDPLAMAPHAAPVTLYFQFARDDTFVTGEAAQRLYDAASNPKLIGWYTGAHDLDEQAARDRDAWLEEQLSVTTN